MRNRFTLFAVVLSVAAVYAFWKDGATSTALAGSENSVSVLTSATTLVLGADEAEYVGSTKCKKCHLADHKSWEKTKHGTALEALKPGNAAEVKTKYKLDPAKDYSKDATCLACHVVGLGKKGGYEIPADEEAAKKMKPLEGVGCEACHGAGGAYMALHDEIMKSKRKYKEEEMIKSGTIKPDQKVCVTCHNDKGPTFDAAKPFDFEKMKEKGVHDHAELKQLEK